MNVPPDIMMPLGCLFSHSGFYAQMSACNPDKTSVLIQRYLCQPVFSTAAHLHLFEAHEQNMKLRHSKLLTFHNQGFGERLM